MILPLVKPVLSSDVKIFSQSRRIACEAPEMPVSPMTGGHRSGLGASRGMA